MKIKSTTKKSQTKRLGLILLAVILVLCIGTAFAYFSKLGPFSENKNASKNKVNSSHSDNKQSSEKKSPSPSTSNDSPTTTPSNTSTSPSQSDPGYVNPPISSPPTDTSPYPIENEHYRIAQKSPTNYDVTLYPIANNPDYSDYNAQLKAYKNEVLDYLKKRYGDISKFSFTWSPDSAKNI